ncbi:MAG: hypothetical protein M9921_01970 [Fimbriimonadaceae bacterium]|nr:hypothetical protein [Chthonomonadaceae bacterium]MCO5295603.1 hypothetical protein [Fimbriimonadaceae bacterium]
MPNWKEGDRVRVVARPVTDDDRASSCYYEHMAGLVGVVQNTYAKDEIAVKIDPDSLTKVTASVHKESTKRMREKFVNSVSEEQKKQLTPEELAFDAHYVVLCRSDDLEKA